MNKEFIKLIGIGFLLSLIIGIFLNNLIDALKFALVLTLLFYIPILIWTIKLNKLRTFGKLTISFLLGISIIPTIYIIIGFFTPLNTILFIVPSILIFIAGIFFNNKYKQKTKGNRYEPANNNPGI